MRAKLLSRKGGRSAAGLTCQGHNGRWRGVDKQEARTIPGQCGVGWDYDGPQDDMAAGGDKRDGASSGGRTPTSAHFDLSIRYWQSGRRAGLRILSPAVASSWRPAGTSLRTVCASMLKLQTPDTYILYALYSTK